ncbi:Enzymatic polyprotein [Dictyocoela muelleri]|nr:Enzymatic polyprotein [Dictyocoela muelleri]
MSEYSLPLGLRNEVEEHLSELLKAGIIKEEKTEFYSPAFIIRKENGKIRLVVDYRYLNSLTIKTHQYLPKISDILTSYKDSSIFSLIDLNQGHYQIRMHPRDI